MHRPLPNAPAALAAVMLVSFIGTVGIALPYPILAPYFLDPAASPGLTRFAGIHPKILLGIILALYPLGLLIGGAFIGALSDQFGRRRTLIYTLLLALAGYVGSVLALRADSFLAFALMRLLTGIAEGNIAVARAIALDLHPIIDRKRSLSLVFAANYTGWLVGPIAGGYLMALGIEAAFVAAGFTVLLCLAMVRLGLPPDPATVADGHWWQSLRHNNSLSLLRHPGIRPLIIFHLLYSLGLNTFYEYFPLWLVEAFGHGPVQIAWLSVSLSLTMIVTSAFFVGHLSRLGSDRNLIIASVLLLGFCMCVLPWSGALLCWLLFALIGAGIALENGIFPAFMSANYGAQGEGKIMGLLTTNFCLANVIMALAGAVLALAGGLWVMLCAGLLCLLAALWIGLNPDPKQ